MPFCPNCQSEYRPGFTRCRDCDVDLVAALPPAEEGIRTAIELVNVATFLDLPQAQMVRELLEENGIATILLSDAGAGISTFGFPCTLQVGSGDAERARALYEEYFAGNEAAEQKDDDPETKEDST